MRKGSLFLLLTFVGLVALFVFLFFFHEQPVEDAATAHSQGLPRGLVASEDCGYDIDCFVEAVEDDCRAVTFFLPNPLNDTLLFNGRVLGPTLGKCDVYIEDKETNQSMRCYIGESAFGSVDSPEALRTLCSGDLLDSILQG